MTQRLLIKASTLALAAVLLAPMGAVAGGSHNTKVLSAVTFDKSDPGETILFIWNQCNSSPVTRMANGPYKRIDVEDAAGGGGPVQGGGGSGQGGGGQGTPVPTADSRLDYVILTIPSAQFSSPPSLSGTDIEAQIGINPGVILSVDISYDAASDVLSITDTSSGPSQIMDLGGFDAVLVFDGVQNNTVQLECDMNMWEDSSGTASFGVNVTGQTRTPSSVKVVWAAGPSPFAHQELAAKACQYANRAIDSTGAPADGSETPDISREAFTVGLGGDSALLYGDIDQAANYTACTGLAAYCDSTEQTPVPALEEPEEGQLETNLCNPLGGGASPPNVSVLTVNEGNASCTKTVFGVTMRFDPCPPE